MMAATGCEQTYSSKSHDSSEIGRDEMEALNATQEPNDIVVVKEILRIDFLRREITEKSEIFGGLLDSCHIFMGSVKQHKPEEWTVERREPMLAKVEEVFSAAETELNNLEAIINDLDTRVDSRDAESRKFNGNLRMMRDDFRNAIDEWEAYLEKEIEEATSYYGRLIKERAAKEKGLSDWVKVTSSFILNLSGSRDQRLQEIERILTEIQAKEHTLKWIQELDMILEAEYISNEGNASNLVQAWNELQQLAVNIKQGLKDDDQVPPHQSGTSASVHMLPPTSVSDKSVKKGERKPSPVSVRLQIRSGKTVENAPVTQQPKPRTISSFSHETPGVNSVDAIRIRTPKSKDIHHSRKELKQAAPSRESDSRHGCHICFKTFASRQYAQCHVLAQHFGEKRCKCPSCPKTFENVHTKKGYNCPVCLKHFGRPDTLIMHLGSHAGERTVQHEPAVRDSSICLN